MHIFRECQYRSMDHLGISITIVTDTGGLKDAWIPYTSLKDPSQIDIFAEAMELEIAEDWLREEGLL